MDTFSPVRYSSKSKTLLLAGNIWGLKAGEARLQTVNPNEKPISNLTVFRCLYFQKTAGFASGFLLIFPAKSRFSLFDVH
jgi:hypothetical protein